MFLQLSFAGQYSVFPQISTGWTVDGIDA